VLGEKAKFLGGPQNGRARAHRGLTDADFSCGGFTDFRQCLRGVQLLAAKHE
jgi:hypothetical protein